MLHDAGGYVSVLDMNGELGEALIKELGSERLTFFVTDVSKTESIAAAVKGTLEWVKQTGKELGGVVAAAGISNPGKVRPRPSAALQAPRLAPTNKTLTTQPTF